MWFPPNFTTEIRNMSGLSVENSPPASPTGTPLVSSRTVSVALIGGILATVGDELTRDGSWDIVRVGSLLVRLIPLLVGAFSPGIRK